MTPEREQWIETAKAHWYEIMSRRIASGPPTDPNATFTEDITMLLDAVLPQIETAVRARVLAEVQEAIADGTYTTWIDSQQPHRAWQVSPETFAERVREIGASS